jgi:NADH-quinone oxidoreductase subunit E
MNALSRSWVEILRRLRAPRRSEAADREVSSASPGLRPPPLSESDDVSLPSSTEAPVTPPARARVQPSVDLDDPEAVWLPKVRALLGRHEGDLVGALLGINEAFGFLPRNVLAAVADLTGTPLVRLVGIASYYHRFRLEPLGRHRLSVCLGTACHVAGGPTLVDGLGARLGVVTGGTSSDRLFTLETVACLGCCSLAPVLAVDGDIRGRVRNTDALRVVARLRENAS